VSDAQGDPDGCGAATGIEVYDHQDIHALDPGRFRRFALAALSFCRGQCLAPDSSLATLGEIEVSLVDDATIAQVHGEYLGDPTPTDVITFDHGEILVSTETAARQAPEHGNTFEREIATYIAHGLLHLAGLEDATPEGFIRMRALQDEAVRACW